MPKRLFLIDGHAHCYQAYYAIKGLTGPDGQPVNAIYGFARMLKKLQADHRPDYLAVVFDPPGRVFRHEIYEQYKATRKPMPDALQEQLPLIREMLERQGTPVLVVEGYEADDVMASAARRAARDGVASVLVTTDKDAEQLIDEMTSVLHLHKDRAILLDREGLKDKHGLEPWQVVEMMALAGDSGDNVPGVPGVGPKTAASLIRRFGSVQNLYARLDEVESESLRERLAANREQVELSRRLVLIERAAPVELDLEQCRTDRIITAGLNEFFRALGFRSLLEDEQGAQQAAAPGPHRQGGLFAEEASAQPPQALDSVGSKDVNYRTAASIAEVRRLCGELREHAPFALDLETTSLEPHDARLVGVALSWRAYQGVYVPTAAPPGEAVCPAEQVLAELKPLLEDASVGKIGQNLKYDMQVLRHYGLCLNGVVCDTMVASYLLHPSETSHGLDALARRHLNYRTVPISDLIGTGHGEVSLDELPVQQVARYACEDADVAFRLAEVLMPQLAENELMALFRDIELPLVPVLAEMEWRGIKIDKEELERASAEFERELKSIEERIHEEAGEKFNVNSPKQLSHVLFERMGLPRPAGKQRTTGYSTDSSVLTDLAQQHPIASHLLRWRELSKLKGTYADALLKLVNPTTGRLHTSFHQTGTATGRLSSSEPNLQNIPVRTPLGRRIRRAFVPGEQDMVLLSADYSQVELRMLAHCSGDQTLQQAFREDRDIHRFVAAQVNDIPEAEVTPEMRQQAKAVNFGIIYGLSAYGLSRQIGVPLEQAQRFISDYFKRYPQVKRFIGATIAQARRDGYVRTLAGRRRSVPGIRASGAVRSAAERIAVNSVVQGSAADLIKMAMIAIARGLPGVSARSGMLLQIHDELLFEVPRADVDAVRSFVAEKMNGAMQLSVPLKVEVTVGRNWEETK